VAEALLPGVEEDDGSPLQLVPDEGAAIDVDQYLQEYHALKLGDELAKDVQNIVTAVKSIMRTSGIFARVRVNWNLYYARDGGFALWEENLRADGEEGESVRVTVNITRNLVRHILSMICSVRAVVDPKAKNTDHASIDAVQIVKALADEYLHGQKHVQFVDRATEGALVLDTHYIHRYWDEFAGGVADTSQMAGIPEGHVPVMGELDGTSVLLGVHRGDIRHENVTKLDVFFDQTATCWEEVDDVVVRTYRNRYDLMALHPENADRIKSSPGRSAELPDEYLPSPSLSQQAAGKSPSQDTKIEVWYYYHRKTPSVPKGRQMLLLPDGTWLSDGPLEWDDIPLFHFQPEHVLGSVHGYCPVTSLGGMQESLDTGISAIITSIFAFGRTTLLYDKNQEDLEPSEFTGGMKFIGVTFDEHGQPPVKALEIPLMRPEMVEALKLLQGWMEQDAGVNAIVRGDPKGVTAGIAINLFSAMALQFASPTEAVRAKAIEWMVMGIVEAHRRHPNVPRDLAIVGKSKQTQLKTFYGSQFEGIDRVDVDMGNPMSRTVAGRLQMLQAIRQDGAPIPPQMAMQILQTGNLDAVIEPETDEMNLILAENEQLAQGQVVPARPGDDHLLHLQRHRQVGANPELRFKPGALNALDEHEQMHVQFWLDGDVVLKIAKGGLPMGPMQPMGPAGALPAMANGQPSTPGKGAAPPPAPKGPVPQKKGPPLGELPALKPPSLTPLPPVVPQ
jgi:hypothetical protein